MVEECREVLRNECVSNILDQVAGKGAGTVNGHVNTGRPLYVQRDEDKQKCMYCIMYLLL
jgi:hypothetical protein